MAGPVVGQGFFEIYQQGVIGNEKDCGVAF